MTQSQTANLPGIQWWCH